MLINNMLRYLSSAVCVLVLFLSGVPVGASPSYTLFEAGQVRPLAQSPDGKRLFALNTPNGTLEIFRIVKSYRSGNKTVDLVLDASVPVGLEPVALAVRSNNEVWVVNHLSDSVSVVKLDRFFGPHVHKTLLVGDEPRDIVFAGRNNSRAFITTAHRGQNHPLDPQLTTPGVGRADVWVYDTRAVKKKRDVQPLNIITLFTDSPRALAVSSDGKTVYAAGFKTGNQTTSINEIFIPDGGEENGGLPNTRVDAVGEEQPENGLIVKFNGSHWVDELGRVWDDRVNFNLPDKDVFVIDAMANPPQVIATDDGFYTGVGTVLFNMIVNPANGAIYVSNTDLRNENRFEGEGLRLGREHTVQGNFVRNRISVLKDSTVTPVHLNKHINYSECCETLPNNENALSIAQPMDMAITKDGKTLFVTGFGSQKIAIYKTAELESDSFEPSLDDQVKLSGGGPSGIVVDEERGALYVLTRFDNAVTVIDIDTKTEVKKTLLFNPEPESIVNGRRFLYDAGFTSSHGDASCASCHIFGDTDALAWDLGNPDIVTENNPGPFVVPAPPGFPRGNPDFRALKGPMSTQSLRGLANHGPMHWRGDRTGGNDEQSFQPDSGAFNEDLAFKKFNAAFVGLNGRDETLSEEDMQAFTDFILQVTYPPNPIRNLDNSLTESQAAGREIYFGDISDIVANCHGCHVLDPDANAEFGVDKPGHFGADGQAAFENMTQLFKIPHLRNMYQKVGMFGMPVSPGAGVDNIVDGDNEFMGDQIRGFGFQHDGTLDTLYRVMGRKGFIRTERNPGGFPRVPDDTPGADEINAEGNKMRRDLEQFMLAFDSNMAPIVGQQITLSFLPSRFQLERLLLLKSEADRGACDLVASRGRDSYLYESAAAEFSGAKGLNIDNVESRSFFSLVPVTFLCAPPGAGKWMVNSTES